MEVKLTLKHNWNEVEVTVKGYPLLVEKIVAAIKAAAMEHSRDIQVE